MPVLPRLGDRADLRIELQPSAVQSYQQTRLAATHVRLTDAEATEELTLDVLPLAHVTYSSGAAMSVRARVRRLEVDVQADLIRISPAHVRCHRATVRRLDVRESKKSRAGDETYRAFRVYDNQGRRMGFIRAPRLGGAIEYRPAAEDNGAPAPPWVPIPEHVRAAIRQVPANAPALAWFEARNIRP